MSNPFGTARARRWAPWLGFGPAFTLFLVFAGLPALAVVALSLTDVSGIQGVPWHWVGFHNYTRFFSGPQASDNWSILKRTLIFCVAVTAIQNAVALVIAVLLNSKLRGGTFFRSVIFLPVVLGVTVIGLTWSLIFNPTGGPGASLWHFFGSDSAFFGSPNLAFPLIIFVQIWASMGYSMMIFLAGLQSVPAELYEAAEADGAGAFGRFRHVTVPMLAPAVTANVLIAVIGSLQSYQLIYVLSGSNINTQVLSLKVFSTAFGTNASAAAVQDQGYASAISIIQFVIIGVVAIGTLFYFRRRETQL